MKRHRWCGIMYREGNMELGCMYEPYYFSKAVNEYTPFRGFRLIRRVGVHNEAI